MGSIEKAEHVCKKLVKMFQQLLESKELSIKDEMPPKPGVYAIFENEQPLYVGSSDNLNRRIKRQLWSVQNHTLGSRWLMKRFEYKIEEVRNYLQKCTLKIRVTESIQEAKALEQF